MVKNHLSRLNAPKSWPIRRKGIKFITRPSPGPHNLKECIPMSVVLQNLLKYAKTNRETKKILNEGKILVNNKVRKDHRYSLGNFDIIAIPDLKEYYLVYRNTKDKFKLLKIDEKEANNKLYKIKDKTITNKGKIQLNLFNGSNLLVDKDAYKTGDSLIIDLNTKKINKHLKLEKGARVYIIGGKRTGMVAKLVEFKKLKEGKENIVFEADGKKLETSKDYAFVIGDLKL